MKSFYAMRRANGDWFALDDGGQLRMPVFASAGEAMIARSRDTGMECFRPVAIDTHVLEKLTATEGQTASFFVVSDPLRKLKHARRVGFAELALLISTKEPTQTDCRSRY
jgi:hypothetical protein